MNLTRGETEALTAETVPEILERVKREIASEERAKVDLERAKAEMLAGENERLRRSRDDSIKQLYWLSDRIGAVSVWIVGAICIAGSLLVCNLIPEAWLHAIGANYWIGLAVATAALIGGVLGFISLVLGYSVKDLLRRLRTGIATLTFRWLKVLFRATGDEA